MRLTYPGTITSLKWNQGIEVWRPRPEEWLKNLTLPQYSWWLADPEVPPAHLHLQGNTHTCWWPCCNGSQTKHYWQRWLVVMSCPFPPGPSSSPCSRLHCHTVWKWAKTNQLWVSRECNELASATSTEQAFQGTSCAGLSTENPQQHGGGSIISSQLRFPAAPHQRWTLSLLLLTVFERKSMYHVGPKFGRGHCEWWQLLGHQHTQFSQRPVLNSHCSFSISHSGISWYLNKV